MMASKSYKFLDGLEFYFITKKLDEVQRFEGSVSDRSNENTTHARAFFSWKVFSPFLRKGNPTRDTIQGKVKDIFR